MAADDYFTVWQAPFTALITGSQPADGIWYYSWEEQYVNPATGEYVTLYGGRSGTYAESYATEANNNEVPAFIYRRLWFKSLVDGQPVYEFEYACCGDFPSSSSSSSSS